MEIQDFVLEQTKASKNDDANVSVLQRSSESLLSSLKQKYIAHGEQLLGLGYGGSESLTIFIRNENDETIVRKILNEQYITAKWPRDGSGPMLSPVQKAIRQANYLNNLPESARHLFPRVLSKVLPSRLEEITSNGEYKYDMTYIKGIEVSKFIREYQPSPKVVAMLYAEIFRSVKQNIHAFRRTPAPPATIESAYFKKIEKRLDLCKKTSPMLFGDSLIKSDFVILNGKKLLNWHRVIETIKNNKDYSSLLEPKYHNLVIGDTNTENIKIENIQPLLNVNEALPFSFRQFTAEEIGLKFLDPRAIGYHIGDRDTGVDDYMYDNKPWHNSIGNYDDIHGEHFDINYDAENLIPAIEIEFHANSPYRYPYSGIENYFGHVMNSVYEYHDKTSKSYIEDPNWLVRFVFVMGTHFMAMPPFHFVRNDDGTYGDNAQCQKRALAIYAEGLRWLNCALDLLEGKRKSFLGILNYQEDKF